MASSSATLNKYDVFLSFRGEDTRYNFTSHLYAALLKKKIKTYMDDDGLERGDEISQALLKAIEESRLSVIIFSKDYASSSWCLNELVHILKCQNKNKQIVVPVFYHVDPSHVRRQEESYATAFDKLEKRFGHEIGRVQKWRDALTTAANLSGWDSREIRSESKLVERIVEDIMRKLNRIPSTETFKRLVGINKRIGKIESLLRIGSTDVRTIGIWGIGGVGKTTLAQVTFNRLSSQFEACCFLENIREEWDKDQKYQLKTKLYSDLLEEENPNLGSSFVESAFSMVRLCDKKVLIILDDMDDLEQFEFLVGDRECFGPGTRIIITTRNLQILRSEADEYYKVDRLDSEEALQLFNSHAFRRTIIPAKDFTSFSESVINYAEGIPLVLEVLGSLFGSKKQENWEVELNKLKKLPCDRIQNSLRISYDGLDENQKCVFLDIACFFKGEFRDFAEGILDACGLFATVEIDDLIDRSLITIKDHNTLWMHDLVQEMARAILRDIKMPEMGSRLWSPEDGYHVLKNKTGRAEVEGISFNMSNFTEVHFHPAAFRKMYKLRFLHIFNSNVHKKCRVFLDHPETHLQFLPDSLRYLHWDGYPWKSFPSSFRPQYLVELNLPNSKVTQLWEGTQDLRNLRKIDLSQSGNLINLPDLSQASNLEHLYLEHCTSLRQIPSYFQDLNGLITLVLNGCSSVQEFPELPQSILCLVMSGTAIEKVPSSIRYLSCLEILNLADCKKLVMLPNLLRPMQRLKSAILPSSMLTSVVSVLPRGDHGFKPGQGHFRTANCTLSKKIKSEIPQWIGAAARHTFNKMSSESGISGKSGWFTSNIGLQSKRDCLPLLPVKYLWYDKPVAGVETVNILLTGLEYLSHVLAGLHGPEFIFYNCLEVCRGGSNNNMIDRIQDLCSSIAFQEFTSVFHLKAKVGVFCPGNEIPRWFHYQFAPESADGTFSTVGIEFPPNSLTTNFLGFAICAIVELSSETEWVKVDCPRQDVYDGCFLSDYQEIILLCEVHFTTSDGIELSWESYFEDAVYDRTRTDWFIMRERIVKASFKLSCVGIKGKILYQNAGRVKKCGIHLLYAEDANKFEII